MRAIVVGCLLVCSIGSLGAQEEPAWMGSYRAMLEARQAGDAEGWLRGARATLDGRPDHPILMFHEARALGVLGRHEEAVAALARIVAVGAWLDPGESPELEATRATAAYQVFIEAAKATRAHAGPSRVGHEIATPGIVPEGIARDPRDGALYVGSMTGRSILRVRADGTTEEVIASGRDGLLDPLGIDIDPGRDEIWAVSVVAPELGEREGVGRTAVHAWRLRDRQLITRVVLEPKENEPHQLNDLAIAADGAVYTTDPVAGMVWRVGRGPGAALEPMSEPGAAPGANGIIVDETRKVAWIGCYNFGLCRLDLETREVEILDPPAGVTLLGIDGLELHDGNLLAIQNAYGLDRLVHISLDPSGRAITAVEVLDARHPAQHDPTTGVVVPPSGGAPARFLWIANARIDPWYRSGGKEQPTGPTFLLGVDLGKGLGE